MDKLDEPREREDRHATRAAEPRRRTDPATPEVSGHVSLGADAAGDATDEPEVAGHLDPVSAQRLVDDHQQGLRAEAEREHRAARAQADRTGGGLLGKLRGRDSG